jgi:hypothetical protein
MTHAKARDSRPRESTRASVRVEALERRALLAGSPFATGYQAAVPGPSGVYGAGASASPYALSPVDGAGYGRLGGSDGFNAVALGGGPVGIAQVDANAWYDRGFSQPVIPPEFGGLTGGSFLGIESLAAPPPYAPKPVEIPTFNLPEPTYSADDAFGLFFQLLFWSQFFKTFGSGGFSGSGLSSDVAGDAWVQRPGAGLEQVPPGALGADAGPATPEPHAALGLVPLALWGLLGTRCRPARDAGRDRARA